MLIGMTKFPSQGQMLTCFGDSSEFMQSVVDQQVVRLLVTYHWH